MAQIDTSFKKIPEGKCDICNIPGIRTVIEVEHSYGLVLPPEIIEFKITVNEAIVRFCHWERRKPRGDVIEFDLYPWFIFWHIDLGHSEVIPPCTTCG